MPTDLNGGLFCLINDGAVQGTGAKKRRRADYLYMRLVAQLIVEGEQAGPDEDYKAAVPWPPSITGCRSDLADVPTDALFAMAHARL